MVVPTNPSSAAVLSSPFDSHKPLPSKPSVWSIAKEIYTDSSLLSTSSTWYTRLRRVLSKEGASTWAARIEGLKGFSRGIQATSISGFVGSAGTISQPSLSLVDPSVLTNRAAVFEGTLMLLGNKNGGGGGVG